MTVTVKQAFLFALALCDGDIVCPPGRDLPHAQQIGKRFRPCFTLGYCAAAARQSDLELEQSRSAKIPFRFCCAGFAQYRARFSHALDVLEFRGLIMSQTPSSSLETFSKIKRQTRPSGRTGE
jgi:hypothetical protein